METEDKPFNENSKYPCLYAASKFLTKISAYGSACKAKKKKKKS